MVINMDSGQRVKSTYRQITERYCSAVNDNVVIEKIVCGSDEKQKCYNYQNCQNRDNCKLHGG